MAGYLAAWKALPPSVEHVIVIRDTPKVHGDTDSCVQEALGEGDRPGRACAVPRRAALDRDPAAVAAARLGSSRVRTVDLTRFFCDRRRCYPVIGGALVFKDPTHLTRGVRHEPRAVPAPRPRRRRCALRAGRRPRACRGASAPRRAIHGVDAGTPGGGSTCGRRRAAAKRPFFHCKRIFRLAEKRVCGFGVAPARATKVVALIGDSHAGQWAPAVDAVARRHRWQGIQLGHASCPLSRAVRNLVEPNRSHCLRWRRALFAWFAQHPEVSTVFVSQLTGGSGVVPTRGRSEFATAMAGYAAAWRRLPRSVKQIVVIRDTPKVHGNTDTCVERAMARRAVAGLACAVPRSTALDADPAFAAARRLRSGRVRAVDLTRYFCDRRRCYPVIGGALVFKDTTHLTGVYSTTLAPYLLRAIDGALRP